MNLYPILDAAQATSISSTMSIAGTDSGKSLEGFCLKGVSKGVFEEGASILQNSQKWIL